MAHVWSTAGYQQASVTVTAHVPHAQGCCNRRLHWPVSAACRETPWHRLPELSVAGGRLLGQAASQVAARTSLSGMGQLAAPPGSSGQFSTAQASCAGECMGCRVPAEQVRSHCRAEVQGNLWRWRMDVSLSWARTLGSGGHGAGTPCTQGQGSSTPSRAGK